MPVSGLPEWIIAALLGALQGVTEFLPVSSSAHLIIAREEFGWSFGGERMNLLFDVMLHVGTMLAILFYFRRDLWRIFSSLFRAGTEHATDRRLAWGILAATVPAALAGALFEDVIVELFRRQMIVIVGLLAGVGLLMWAADRWGRQRREVKDVRFWEAVLVGVAQAAALMPGVSRSGGTITMGLALGLRREEAARFSFLLSTPAVVGAAVWTMKDAVRVGVPSEAVSVMAVGLLVSLVVGMASIAFLLRFLRERTVLVFTLYRLAIAAYLLFTLLRTQI